MAASADLSLKVQVKMTDAGPKTLIKPLDPDLFTLSNRQRKAIHAQVQVILAKHPLKLGELSPVFLMILRDSLASTAQDDQSAARKTVAMHPAIERQIQQARSSRNKKTPVTPVPNDNLSTPNDNVGTPNEKVNIVPVSSTFNTSPIMNTHRVPITSPLVPLALSTGAAVQRNLAQNEGKVVVTENRRVIKTGQLLPDELIAYNLNCNDLSNGASQRLSQNRVVNDSNTSNSICDANNESYVNAHQSNLDVHNLFPESSASDSSRGHKRKWSDLSDFMPTRGAVERTEDRANAAFAKFTEISMNGMSLEQKFLFQELVVSGISMAKKGTLTREVCHSLMKPVDEETKVEKPIGNFEDDPNSQEMSESNFVYVKEEPLEDASNKNFILNQETVSIKEETLDELSIEILH